MDGSPNDFYVQQRNITRGEDFLAKRNEEYSDLRNWQEDVLPIVQNVNHEIEQQKQVLRLMAWKWTLIHVDQQNFEEIIEEVDDLMQNGYVLPRLADQISNTNVDLAVLEAYTFYHEVNERMENYLRRHGNPKVTDEHILTQLDINVDQYYLSKRIRYKNIVLLGHYDNLQRLTVRLKSVENRIRQLQSEINSYLEN